MATLYLLGSEVILVLACIVSTLLNRCCNNQGCKTAIKL